MPHGLRECNSRTLTQFLQSYRSIHRESGHNTCSSVSFSWARKPHLRYDALILNFLPSASKYFRGRRCSAKAGLMTLKIFFDDKSFHCLKRAIPPGSNSKLVLAESVQFKNVGGCLFGSNAVISCEEVEARNLLLYAGHCPGAVASIRKALLSAGLLLDDPTPR